MVHNEKTSSNDHRPPASAKWFLNGFHTFLKPFLRRHFHTIAVHADSNSNLSLAQPGPVIVFANHPSWWDPLIAHYLCRNCFSHHMFYAPIDARALQQYAVFKKLGFYGIDLTSQKGAADFLRTSMAILSEPFCSLWITPEGRFADCRDYQAELMPGLAHLCSRTPHPGFAIPLALEYVFWDERLPECFVRFGAPLPCGPQEPRDKLLWKETLAAALRENQTCLANAVIARDPAAFEPILSGKRGAGGFYDSLRRLRSLVTRSEFHSEHGSKFN